MFESISSWIRASALPANPVLGSLWRIPDPSCRGGWKLADGDQSPWPSCESSALQNKHRGALYIPLHATSLHIKGSWGYRHTNACKHRRKFTWLPTRHKETIKPSLPVGLCSHPPSGHQLPQPMPFPISQMRDMGCVHAAHTHTCTDTHTHTYIPGFQ